MTSHLRLPLLLALTLFMTLDLFGQEKGDFRSAGSGNWRTGKVWEQYDGSTWIGAKSCPDDSAAVVTICDKNLVTITDGVRVKFIRIAWAGKLKVDTTGFLICLKGMDAIGKVENFGVIDVHGQSIDR